MTSIKINHVLPRQFSQERWSSGLGSLIKPNLRGRSISPNGDVRKLLDDKTTRRVTPTRLVEQNLHSRLHWLTRPELKVQSMQSNIAQEPLIPHRTRKIKIREEKGQQRLKVSDLQMSGNKHSESFICKEVKKEVNLPKTVKCGELVSFMTPDGKVVLGVPVKQRSLSPLKQQRGRSISPLRKRGTSPHVLRSTSPMLPRFNVNDTKVKHVCIKLHVPAGVTADKISITLQDRELIMRCVDKASTADSTTRINVLNSVILPENTVWSELKCVKQNGVVIVTAPLNDLNGMRRRHSIMHDSIGNIDHIVKQDKDKKKKKKKTTILDDMTPFHVNENMFPFFAPTSGKKKGKGKVRGSILLI